MTKSNNEEVNPESYSNLGCKMEDRRTDMFHCMVDTNTLDHFRQIRFQQRVQVAATKSINRKFSDSVQQQPCRVNRLIKNLNMPVGSSLQVITYSKMLQLSLWWLVQHFSAFFSVFHLLESGLSSMLMHTRVHISEQLAISAFEGWLPQVRTNDVYNYTLKELDLAQEEKPNWNEFHYSNIL